MLTRPSYGENDARAWAPSAWRGGSPGYAETNGIDFLRPVKINEFLADPPSGEVDSIELYNACNYAVDLSGCYLARTNDSLADYRIPNGTVLAPREFKLFLRNQSFTFPVDKEGDHIFLVSPDRTRVIDAVHFDQQDEGITTGRTRDGAPIYSELAARTLGGTNSAPLIRNIVINEIMYNPIFGGDDSEYIEIYNRGATAQSLSGWHFDGVTFSGFGSISLQPSNFVVVAASTNSLLTNYPGGFTYGVNLIGEYSGNLANGGERIALLNSSGVVMDEVTYSDGGRWGKWSDGAGGSLELVDSRSDNRLASNWADSAAATNSVWATIEDTGYLNHGAPGVSANAVEIILSGEAECYLDDVEIIRSGSNYVVNSSFNSGTNNWLFQGNHDQTAWCSTCGTNGTGGLHVKAAGRGDTVANRLWGDLTTSLSLTQSNAVTIRVKARWLRGHSRLIARLHGNSLEAVGVMSVPTALGTPGLINSVALTNASPAISDVQHFPVLPAAGELVVVFARVNDPDGATNVVLKYRVDPATNLTSVTMRDDGTLGDALARDGIFSASISGQSAGTMIAFRIEATDAFGASSRFPTAQVMYPGDTQQRECLIRFGEASANGSFGTYRLWLTEATRTNWTNRLQLHNGPLDVTFVSASNRVIYNATARYSGSTYNTPFYDGPTNLICGYNLTFPGDERMLGSIDMGLDWPRGASAAQNEQLAYWTAEQLGLPFTYRRFIHLYVNGIYMQNRELLNGQGAKVYEDAQEVGGDFLEQWFPGNANGLLHKLNPWEEFASNGSTRELGQFIFPSLQIFLTTNVTSGLPVKKTARYRWNWEKRAEQVQTEDWTVFFKLVDAVNTNTSYVAEVENVADIEQWMRVFALEDVVSNSDSYGNEGAKNTYAYQPVSDKWRLLLWDLDGAVPLGTNYALFPTAIDPPAYRMQTNTTLVRAYWRALQDAVNGPMLAANYTAFVDGNYNALDANGVTNASPSSMTTAFNNRRSVLTGELAKVMCGLAITNNGGVNFTTSQGSVLLAGKAPPQVKFLSLNTVLTNVVWHTVTNWNLSVTLSNGANSFTVQGYDRFTNSLSGTNASITITKQ